MTVRIQNVKFGINFVILELIELHSYGLYYFGLEEMNLYKMVTERRRCNKLDRTYVKKIILYVFSSLSLNKSLILRMLFRLGMY